MVTNKRVLTGISMLFVVATLTACSGGGGGGSDSGGSPPPPPSGTTSGGGDQYGSGSDPIAAPSGNPTSYDLIDAAKTAGTITEQDALTYKMFAEFGDSRLPVQYRGDDAGYIEGDAQHQVLAYIARVGIGSVPAATLDTLRPFFVPAHYEGSWWHKQHPGAVTAAAVKISAATKANPNCRAWETACSLLAEWKSVAGTNVVVWYLAANETTDLPKAAMLVQEFDTTIWPKLTGLMGRTPLSDAGTGLPGETDARLDVLLVDLPGTKEAETVTSTIIGCKAVPAHIYLSRALPNRGLIAQAAHEFMHAIQFSINVRASCLENYYTTLEATAVWATNYVYPLNDWEHTYAKYYLTGNNVSNSYDYRPAKQSPFRYGAYVFPLFLETRFGPSIVKGIWDQTTTFNDELFAIEGAIVAAGSSFSEEWPKFVVANWNRDTITTYAKADTLFEKADLNGDAPFTLPAGGTGSLTHALSLEHASAAYYRVAFGDSVSRSVAIVNGLSFSADSVDMSGFGNNLAFTGLDALSRRGASMQVFVKVNGAWQSEPADMVNAPWHMFCRDDPAGKVEEIIFMYANAEISPTAPNYTLTPRRRGPGLLATNIGCRDWTGDLSMSRPLPGGSETLVISGIVLKNVMPTAAPSPGAGPPAYPLAAGSQTGPGFGWVYAITSGSATWTYNDNSDGCTRTGSDTFAIAGPNPGITNSGYTPPGAANHGIAIPMFLGNALPAVANLAYDWRCVGPGGAVTTGTNVVGTNLDVGVSVDDPSVRISTSTGLSVSGTGAQSRAFPDATGSWSLQGATN